MTNSAPTTRLVDMLSGKVAAARPSKFFAAQVEADEHLREFDRLARDKEMLRAMADELLVRVDELKAELDSVNGHNIALSDECRELRAQLEQARK